MEFTWGFSWLNPDGARIYAAVLAYRYVERVERARPVDFNVARLLDVRKGPDT